MESKVQIILTYSYQIINPICIVQFYVYLCIYYHMKIENKVKAIVKLINSLYHPDEIKVSNHKYTDGDEMLIDVYFSHIDDSYITNPNHYNLGKLKELNLEREIRRTIQNFLDIKTSGLNPFTGFAPYDAHGISIDVRLIE
jgi:hypothetical protein